MSRTEQPTTLPSQPARPVKAFSQPLMWLVVGIPADSWLRYETAYRTDLERIAG